MGCTGRRTRCRQCPGPFLAVVLYCKQFHKSMHHQWLVRSHPHNLLSFSNKCTGVRLLTRLGTSTRSERVLDRRTYTSTSQEPVPSSSASPPYPVDPSFSKLADHLNSLFTPLQFPPDLAARILTHSSHPDALVRNNTRLSFIGMLLRLLSVPKEAVTDGTP